MFLSTKISSSAVLILIIVLSIFFRFYNLNNFQLWTSDEEIASAVVRKITEEHKPPLVIPNSILAISLGPYFHYFSAILFQITNSNPQHVLTLMGIVGVLSTYIIFLIGKNIRNIQLGLLASFFYGTSFVIALWDRRWWPLSLNQLFVVISIFSLYKIATGKSIYIVPLAATIGFSWHADPSIAVISFAFALSYFALKLRLTQKSLFLAIATLSIFALPLLLFEIRHPGAVSLPVIQTFQKNTSQEEGNSLHNLQSLYKNSGVIFAHLALPRSSNFAEEYVATGFTSNNSLLPQSFFTFIFLFSFAFPFYLVKKKLVTKNDTVLIKIIYSYFVTFFFGLTLFVLVFKKEATQSYFTILFVPFFILLAYSVLYLIKNKFLLLSVLGIYLAVNVHALLFSSFTYPLKNKAELVKATANELGTSNFSLYINGDDNMTGGGFLSLFILEHKHPQKSNIYNFYDWIYRAYSLYSVEPTQEDQEKIAIISQEPTTNYPPEKILFRKSVGNIHSVILDNEDRWFKN